MNRISASGSSGSPCLPLILHTNMQKTPSMRDKVSRDAESAGSLNVDFSMSNNSSCLSMFGLMLLLLLLYSPYGSGWWQFTFVLLLSLYQCGKHFYS